MSGFVGAMMPGGGGLEKYATDKFKKSGIGQIADEGIGGYLEDKWNKSGLGEAACKCWFGVILSPLLF